MPSTVKKAHILSEEAYNRLTQRSSGDIQAASLATNEPFPQAHSSKPINRHESDSLNDRLETRSAIEAMDDSLQVQEGRHQREVLNSIPAKYRKTAENALRRMEELTCLDLASHPVTYSGKSLGLTVENLLKAVCVPFTRISLPDQLLSELKSAGIPIRNHLAQVKVLPKWHRFFRI